VDLGIVSIARQSARHARLILLSGRTNQPSLGRATEVEWAPKL
jgi:hypothetical protein